MTTPGTTAGFVVAPNPQATQANNVTRSARMRVDFMRNNQQCEFRVGLDCNLTCTSLICRANRPALSYKRHRLHAREFSSVLHHRFPILFSHVCLAGNDFDIRTRCEPALHGFWFAIEGTVRAVCRQLEIPEP
jgi:hypothetical protein